MSDPSQRTQKEPGSDRPPGDPRLITLVVVDDHLLFRQGVTALFADSTELRIIGEAATGDEAIRICRTLQPTVVLMDLNLGGSMDGVQATRQILRDCPGTNVVVISTFYSEEYALPAMKAGAKGYLVKSAGIDNLKRAIKLAAAGGSMIDPLLTPVIMSEYRRMVVSPSGNRGRTGGLTERESTLLRLLAAGYNNRQIADELSLAESTVKNNLSSLFHKIDVRDRTQAVLYAIDTGIVSRTNRPK
jgi:DNA-binding NarL/FixJ family response regulator